MGVIKFDMKNSDSGGLDDIVRDESPDDTETTGGAAVAAPIAALTSDNISRLPTTTPIIPPISQALRGPVPTTGPEEDTSREVSENHDASSQDSTGYHRRVSESHHSRLNSEPAT